MPLFSSDSRTDMMLKHLAGVDYTPPTSWDIAAVTVIPSDELGTGLEEPTSSSYSRLTVSADSDEFEVSSEGSEIINSNNWVFGQATDQGWGTIYGIAIFDDEGEYQGYVGFSSPKVVDINHSLVIPAGSIIFASESSPLSVFIQEVSVPLVRTAPNGTRYFLGVDNSGNVVASALSGAFGPPTPPTSLTNTSGTLSWTTPAADGGSPIVSYSVWRSDSESLLFELASVVAAGGTNEYVTDEEFGSFYVTAENSVGSSDPSNVVDIS